MHGEGPIRTLYGQGNVGALEKGEIGSFSNETMNINFAIPSLRQRKKASSSMTKFVVSPGFIEKSIEILVDEKMTLLNLGLDEKFLSEGIELVENILDDGRTVFTSIGDVDYFFSEINQAKETLLNDLNKHYNTAMTAQSLYGSFLYLSQLKIELSGRIPDLQKSVDSLKQNQVVRKTSLVKLNSRINKIESSIRDIEVAQKRMLINNLVGESFDPAIFDVPGPDEMRIFIPSLETIRSLASTEIPDIFKDYTVIPSDKIFSLTGLGTLKELDEWKTVKYRVSAEVQVQDGENSSTMDIFGPLSLFINLFNKSLKIKENNINYKQYHGMFFRLNGGSFLYNTDSVLKYVHCHHSKLNGNAVMDLIIRMNLFDKPGLLTVETEDSLRIYLLPRTGASTYLFLKTADMLRHCANGSVPKNLTPEIKELRILWKDYYSDVNILADIPKHFKEAQFISKESKARHNEVVGILTCNAVRDLDIYYDVIKTATLNLLEPATQLLALVANSVTGLKKGQHTSDVPVFYARLGKGTTVRKEIKTIVDRTKKELSRHGLNVVCVRYRIS